MTTRRRFAATLYFHDALTLAFLTGLTIVILVFAREMEGWWRLLLQNALFAGYILIVARLDHHHGHRSIIDALHRYYIAPMIFMIFKEIHVLQPFVRPGLFDDALIAIDNAMFGVNPTQWLAAWTPPLLVEVLTLCYFAFYFIMLAPVVEFSLRGRDDQYERLVSALAFGFFLSYIGYLIVPAVGPRFTLHDFGALERELPGLFLTDTLREWMNSGESITQRSAAAILTAQRDAFPSGHTEMTLITIFLAWKFRASVRWWCTMLGIGLIFATVYLRYHYVIDLVCGAAGFLLTIWCLPWLERFWQRVQQR